MRRLVAVVRWVAFGLFVVVGTLLETVIEVAVFLGLGYLIALAFSGCAHELTYDRARELGCREACARAADAAGHASASGWFIGTGECGCRFDDGTVDTTCERPIDGSCS